MKERCGKTQCEVEEGLMWAFAELLPTLSCSCLVLGQSGVFVLAGVCVVVAVEA
jgi:hypothetical protein